MSEEVEPIRPSFLRLREPRRTVVVVPPTLKTDTMFDIIIRNDSWESGEIYIERDGERVVTIRKDGEIVLHQHP